MKIISKLERAKLEMIIAEKLLTQYREKHTASTAKRIALFGTQEELINAVVKISIEETLKLINKEEV